MTTETRKRREYTEDFKREFEEALSGARLGADEREELKRLRKENRLLRMEKEILKKAGQYFAKEMK